MTLYYVDTSAVVRAYLDSEPDHEALCGLLLGGREPVVTSELTRVEFASAVAAAHRDHRVNDRDALLDRFDADCADDGPFTLLRLDAQLTLPLARRLVADERLRTLDAIHLAVALIDAVALAAGEPVVLVTRDHRQSAAARSHGLAVT